MPYNDANLTIRLPRKLKEEAILARLPVSAVCRAAIKEKILNGNGGLPVENIRSLKQAAIVLYQIQPVLTALCTEEFKYQILNSPEPLKILKSQIPVIPDKFLRNYVDFVQGGHFSEQILINFMEAQEDV